MRRLDTDAAKSDLLPKRGTSIMLVLFYRSSTGLAESADALARCEQLKPPPAFELVSLDLDSAPMIAERFALAALPVLAAVYDGSILCLDDEISESSCRRLTELALRQKQSLTGAAS